MAASYVYNDERTQKVSSRSLALRTEETKKQSGDDDDDESLTYREHDDPLI